jgi:hypothetical protein
MDIERSQDTTRIVYHIRARVVYNRVVLHLSGATTWHRANRRMRWQEQSVIYADARSPTGYRAYDTQADSGAPVNHRDYDLVLPDDVRSEALAAITVVWGDLPR